MSPELIIVIAAGAGFIVGRLWQWVKIARAAMGLGHQKRKEK